MERSLIHERKAESSTITKAKWIVREGSDEHPDAASPLAAKLTSTMTSLLDEDVRMGCGQDGFAFILPACCA